MKLHSNARTCRRSRQLLVDRVDGRGWTVQQAAAAAGVSARTGSKWLARFRAEGPAGLEDRSSAARHVPGRLACRALGVRHLRTRPYRPRTNGKAERFIQTLLGGWAYGAIYATSAQRTAALAGWLEHYNHRRPHGSLARQPPITRLTALMNTLLGTTASGLTPNWCCY